MISPPFSGRHSGRATPSLRASQKTAHDKSNRQKLTYPELKSVQTKPTTPELNGYRCSMAIAAALVAEWLDASTQSERFGLPHRRPRSAISDDGATTVRLGNYSVRAQSVRWCHIRTAGQGSSPRSQSGARPDDQDHTAPCKPDMAIANLNATAPEQISFYITAFSFDRRCLQSSITDGPAAGWPS